MPSWVKRTVLLVIGLAGVGALVVVTARMARERRLPPPLTLPSGDKIFLRGVTFGTNHIAPGSPLLRLLPAAARNWINTLVLKKSALFTDRKTTQPVLVLWLESQPFPRGPGSPQPAPGLWIEMADENGIVAGQRQNVFFPWGAKAGLATEFTALPRRGKKIKVRLLEGDYRQSKLVSEWAVSNPAFSSIPPWKAESLPATCTNGEIECTLERVAFGVGDGMNFTSGAKGQQVDFKGNQGASPGAVFLLSFRQGSGNTNGWTVGTLNLRDATGNETSPSSTGVTRLRGRTVYRSSPALWPSETWDVHVSAKREASAAASFTNVFAAEELAIFTNVPLPETGRTATLNQQLTVGGTVIRLAEFTLRPPLPSGQGWSSANATELKATATPGRTDNVYVELIGAADETGQMHYPRSSSIGSGGGSALSYTYGFTDIAAASGQLTFIFAVQRGRDFHFRVKPEIAGAKLVIE